MDGRAAQCPKEECRDVPSLYECLEPDGQTPEGLPPAEPTIIEAAGPALPDGAIETVPSVQVRSSAKGKGKMADLKPHKVTTPVRR
jgi:hypothetical protein